MVAVIQVAILIAEMFFWTKPKIHQQLGFDQDQANKVAPIVANAGLYNGFLAAGLFWGFFVANDYFSVTSFFLLCVIVAGIFGAITIKWTTLAIQTLPALIALVLIWLAK